MSVFLLSYSVMYLQQPTEASVDLFEILIKAVQEHNQRRTGSGQETEMEKVVKVPCNIKNNVTHAVLPITWVGLDEIFMYMLLLLLAVFFSMKIVRCVKTTLDPYSSNRAAWFETFSKNTIQTLVWYSWMRCIQFRFESPRWKFSVWISGRLNYGWKVSSGVVLSKRAMIVVNFKSADVCANT